MQVLGNPEEQDTIAVTAAAAQTQITHGLQSIEFQNLGTKNVYFGKLSTLTSDRGGIIYSSGGSKTFENVGAGWKISFICASGESSTLRRIDYK